jgi:lipopolysaccharide/colanic/teichoic acid biosynthesis glycosyltransferase
MKANFIFSIICSVLIIVFTLPLFIIIPICIIIADGFPIIFCSKRVGYNGKVFTIYKFKTLRIRLWKKDHSLVRCKNDYRIFPFGRFLRGTHLDELPQFINVIKGDMSIIGPRPMPKDYREKNLEILPGITGLAKVRIFTEKTSNKVSCIEQKYDDFYQKKHCTALNAYIALKTVAVMLRGNGI